MLYSDWSSDVCSSDLETRDRALHGQRRIIEAVVAGAREPHDKAIACQLVRAQPLELAHILDALGMRGRREGEAREQQREKGEQGRTLGHFKFLLEEIGRATCRERVCQYV